MNSQSDTSAAARGLRRSIFAGILAAVLCGCGGAGPSTSPADNSDSAQAPTPVSAAAPAATEEPAATGPHEIVVGEAALANAEQLKTVLAGVKGKTLVVNLWATWCKPCVDEMPELVKFYQNRDREKVEFLSISADLAYQLEDVVKPFMTEKSIPFPVHVLDKVPPDDLIALLGVQGSGWEGALPATFIIDSSGALRKTWLEGIHASDIEAELRSVVPAA